MLRIVGKKLAQTSKGGGVLRCRGVSTALPDSGE